MSYDPFSLPDAPAKAKPFGGKRNYSTKAGSKKAGANDEAKNHKGAFYGIDASGVAIAEPERAMGETRAPETPDSLKTPAEMHVMFASATDKTGYIWDGSEYTRVTSVIGVIGKEGLMIWQGQMAAEDCVKQLDLADAGTISLEDAHAAIRDVNTRKFAGIRYRDFKGAVGSIMHYASHEHALGFRTTDVQGYAEELALKHGLVNRERNDAERAEGKKPYSETLAEFAVWYVKQAWLFEERLEPEVEAIGFEAVVINTEENYGGTADRFATFRKEKWDQWATWIGCPWPMPGESKMASLLDFKSSNQLDEFRLRMQLEAYDHAEFIGLVRDGSKHTKPATDRLLGVHVRPLDGPKVVAYEKSPAIWEAFCSARYIHGLMVEGRQLKKPGRTAAAKPAKKDPNKCPFGENI